MIQTFFKVAWRNLFKNKAFSLINIVGLSIGMTCTFLIALWIYSERSWDSFHKNHDEVYHLRSNRNFNGEIQTGQDLMYPLAKTAKATLPEVQYATNVSFGETTLLSVGDKRLNKNTITATPDFFNVFSFETVHGNTATAIGNADALIITESTAKALFGHTNVIDEQVEVNNNRTAYVKAVVKDVPFNSTIQFEAVIPVNPSSEFIRNAEQEWVNCGYRVFFKTTPGTNIASLEKKVHNIIKERSPGENPTTRGSIVMHPMNKWRLYSDFRDGKMVGGRIEYVNLFTWIAVIILIIACVNFMNLSTARSEKRAKEVGVRKTLGSERKQLLWQFICESMLLSFIAFLLSAIFLYLTVPFFSSILNQELHIPFANPNTWLLGIGIIVVTGIIAGSYPAFYLSGFNPVKVLKGTFLPGKQALLPRKILVTGQFIVSIILISATLIIFQQIQHVKKRNLGYDQDKLLMVNSSVDADKNYEALKNDLLKTGIVQSVTRSSTPVTDIYMFTAGIRWANAPQNDNLIIGFLFAHDEYAKTLQAKMLEGRDFHAGDTNKVIFNKEAIKLMGIQNPVGTDITWAGRTRTIIGVMDNVVMTSPYEQPAPFMICYSDGNSGRMLMRLNKSADISNALSSIERIYKKYSVEYPFEYSFVDDAFNTKFNNEQLIGKLSIIFAGVAIFICCLGLFGLVASTIERRKKEIGIRKVLGASVQNLLLLMSKEFLVLVALAFVIAVPAAWWAMNQWLENYTYRVELGVGMFVIVGLIILVIALLTVSLNASKAALSSPVKTLRNE
jgi:ABC-type antimicrobial peptide transport system permease subunit